MPRITIGRLMLAVAGVAVLMALFRVTGPVAGIVVCGWAALGVLTWHSCRLSAEAVIFWSNFQATCVGLVAVLTGMAARNWVGSVVGVGIGLLILYPIHLGCSLGWMSAVRHANRTALVPRSTRLIWVYALAPVGVMVVAFVVISYSRPS